MKRLLTFILILLLSSGLFTGCKKEKGEPPVLPPKESLKIDFSNFESQNKSADLFIVPKGVEDSNWTYAALIAGYWRSLIIVTFAIPVASFESALSNTPVFLEKKTWQWSYSFSILTVPYKARLTGETRASDVAWKMYITREGTGGFAEFLWFDGTSKPDGTGGQWIFYESPQSNVALLQIDWTKTGASISSIKYTIVKDEVNKNGYIEYGLTSATLNGYYSVKFYNNLNPSGVDVDIEWSTTSRNGRVKSSDYLLGQWYCWDSNKVNATCP